MPPRHTCGLIDRCLQLHGGYGYMREYPIARAYLDARVQTIYGGTTEIMKEIMHETVKATIGRSLGVECPRRNCNCRGLFREQPTWIANFGESREPVRPHADAQQLP